ncbi:MAG: hypothetical protein KCHDKBKB_01893 [Elusimicrobia bacterium]|nr:hypothetical protein [Elusimicrobiota bacterium]
MKIFHRPSWSNLLLGLLIVFSILFPPFLLNSDYSYVLQLLVTVGLYMILAMGLNLVVGFLGLLDLGFMAFYAIGAYSMALLSCAGFGFWATLGLSVLLTMGFRLLLGAPVLRLRGDYLAIVTLGFGEITRIVLNNWDSLTQGPKGISLLTHPDVVPITFFGFHISNNLNFYYLTLFFVFVCATLSLRLKYSRIGRAWMAIREDEMAARLTGIQITRMKLIGFVISAGFAGIAGGIFARSQNFVTPESFTFWESVMLVAMVVIGGMGSVGGVLLGAAIVILVPEMLRSLLGSGFVSWRYFLFGLALVLIALYRPQGLWPNRRKIVELE